MLARENVLEYNPALIKESDLPASLLDLAKPEWKGKVAFSPTDADFLPLISAVRILKGREAAVAWLKGLKENGQVYRRRRGRGGGGRSAEGPASASSTAIIGSASAPKQGAGKLHSAIHHFAGGDPGALVNVSGRRGAEIVAQPGGRTAVPGLCGVAARRRRPWPRATSISNIRSPQAFRPIRP